MYALRGWPPLSVSLFQCNLYSSLGFSISSSRSRWYISSSNLRMYFGMSTYRIEQNFMRNVMKFARKFARNYNPVLDERLQRVKSLCYPPANLIGASLSEPHCYHVLWGKKYCCGWTTTTLYHKMCSKFAFWKSEIPIPHKIPIVQLAMLVSLVQQKQQVMMGGACHVN